MVTFKSTYDARSSVWCVIYIVATVQQKNATMANGLSRPFVQLSW